MKNIIYPVLLLISFLAYGQEETDIKLPEYLIGSWEREGIILTVSNDNNIEVTYPLNDNMNFLAGKAAEYDEEKGFIYFMVTTMKVGENDFSESSVENKSVSYFYFKQTDDESVLDIFYLPNWATSLEYKHAYHEDKMWYEKYNRKK